MTGTDWIAETEPEGLARDATEPEAPAKDKTEPDMQARGNHR